MHTQTNSYRRPVSGSIGATYDAQIEAILLGESEAIRRVRWLIGKLARTSIPVLVHGPTGAGKELVARALHVSSGRSGRLVASNVCAIADGLFESTVFGHVRGAFTGAIADAPGLLLEAHGGTAFLDEIGGLAPSGQAKLLRALESHEFRPLGGKIDRRSDFRLVAATNENLDVSVVAGRFRADLLYRLAGATIAVPPLSSRPEDIPLLTRHFLGQRPITDGALAVLAEQPWAGNVRELRGVVECAAALTDRSEVTGVAVEEALALRRLSRAPQPPLSRTNRVAQPLLAALAAHQGDVDAVAAALGVHRATVYRRLRRLGDPGEIA